MSEQIATGEPEAKPLRGLSDEVLQENGIVIVDGFEQVTAFFDELEAISPYADLYRSMTPGQNMLWTKTRMRVLASLLGHEYGDATQEFMKMIEPIYENQISVFRVGSVLFSKGGAGFVETWHTHGNPSLVIAEDNGTQFAIDEENPGKYWRTEELSKGGEVRLEDDVPAEHIYEAGSGALISQQARVAHRRSPSARIGRRALVLADPRDEKWSGEEEL